MSKSKK